MSNNITEKIAKILNQAENAGTEAEAAVFLAKAQELATIHSIDLARARHATKAKERTTPITKTITLGVRGTRGLNTLVNLFTGIARANDVKVNIAHNSTYVVAFGFAEDIEVSEALFASLNVQMAQAAVEWKKTGEWKQDTTYRSAKYVKVWECEHTGNRRDCDYYYGCDYDYKYIPGERVPVSWLSARLDFQQAFGSRVETRLLTAKREAEAAAEASEDLTGGDESTGTALVLVEKREAVADYYAANSTARGSYRGGRSSGHGRAYEAGSQAGQRARLGGSESLPGARKAIA